MGLLESPTGERLGGGAWAWRGKTMDITMTLAPSAGTGKSMSMICGALQGLLDHRQREAELQKQKQQQTAKGGGGEDDDLPDWLMAAPLPGAAAEGVSTRAEEARERRRSGAPAAASRAAGFKGGRGAPPRAAAVGTLG